MEAAASAQEAGNYRLALTKVEAAWMRIVTLPDSEFENESLTWSREGVKQLMDWLQKRANQQSASESAADGRGSIIRPVPVTYRRESRGYGQDYGGRCG